MKIRFLITSLFLAVIASADDSVPSALQITDWAQFSKPVQLQSKKIDRGDFIGFGDPVWVYGYSSDEETLSSYVVGLYKAGTLFKKDGMDMEKRIEEQIEKFKVLAEKDQSKDNSEMTKYVHIETRSDGRKVYFTLMGFGPGGAAYGGFTRLGEYDLLLQQICDSEDNLPPEKKLVHPSEPASEVSYVFRKLEEHILKTNDTEKTSANHRVRSIADSPAQSGAKR